VSEHKTRSREERGKIDNHMSTIPRSRDWSWNRSDAERTSEERSLGYHHDPTWIDLTRGIACEALQKALVDRLQPIPKVLEELRESRVGKVNDNALGLRLHW